MNIKTADEFNDLLDDFKHSSIVVIDTETNGLSVRDGHRPISISLYFPEYDHSYNLAWAHGLGEIIVPQTKVIKTDEQFHKANWQGNSKKQYYKRYWWNRFLDTEPDMGNLPQTVMEEFRRNWNAYVGGKTVIYFNAPFDIHMMQAIGFALPYKIEDVRGLVGLTFEDWLYPTLVHPRTGKAIEGANNGLKWQAHFWGVPGATEGESNLTAESYELGLRLADFILENWDDPINNSYGSNNREPDRDALAKRIQPDPKKEMWMLPSDSVAHYAETDVRITWGLSQALYPKLDAWGQTELYETLNAAQLEFYIRAEQNGMLLDVDVAREQRKKLEPMLEDIRVWFQEQVDILSPEEARVTLWNVKKKEEQEVDLKKGEFKVGSPQKLRAFLYTQGVELPSTDAKTLARYIDANGNHPAISKILEYRKAHRASNTYLKKWISSVDENGYVHPSYNLYGTTTGRTSSSSGTLGSFGNGQNIPSRKFEVKKAIITPPGWVMGQADYSQIEFRLAAWQAGAQDLIEVFNAGGDPHELTMHRMNVRDLMFGSLSDEDIVVQAGLSVAEGSTAAASVYKFCRTVAKTCNFALLYRGTFRVLVRLLDIDQELARELHYSWNSLYPEFEQANKVFEDQALTRRPRPDGSGATFWVAQPIGGRTRKFELYPTFERIWMPDGTAFTQNTRERKARDAFNAVIQGQASYIKTASALRVSRALGNEVWKPFGDIHDSLNFYVREDAAADALPVMLELMEDWDTNPRQQVSLELSPTGSWQDLKEVEDYDDYLELLEDDDDGL